MVWVVAVAARPAAEFALEMRAAGTTSWDSLNGDFDYLPSRTDNRRLIAVATGLDCDTTYEFRVSARGVRHEDDGDTSTFFIDATDAGDKLYVYRVWPYNKYGTSRYSPKAFEWAFMEPS